MRLFRILTIVALAAATAVFFPEGEQAESAGYHNRGAFPRAQPRPHAYLQPVSLVAIHLAQVLVPHRASPFLSSFVHVLPSVDHAVRSFIDHAVLLPSVEPHVLHAVHDDIHAVHHDVHAVRFDEQVHRPVHRPMWVERKRGTPSVPATAVTSGAAAVVPSVPVAAPAPKPVAPVRTYTPTYSSGFSYSSGSCFT